MELVEIIVVSVGSWVIGSDITVIKKRKKRDDPVDDFLLLSLFVQKVFLLVCGF